MRKLNCSRRSFSSSSPRISGVLPRRSFAFIDAPSCPHLALDERRGYRELGRCKTEGLAGNRLAHALDLEQHLAGQHPGHPVFDVALAAAHTHLERLLRDRHVREYPYPDAAAALHIAGNRAPRRFYFARGHAAPIGGLHAELDERDRVAALRAARNLALELFAELGPLRLHHAVLPDSTDRGSGGFRGLRRGLGLGRGALALGVLEHFALEDPNLDADHAIGGLRLGKTVVDVGAEGMQRHASLAVGLGTRDFRSVEPAGDAHLDAQRTRTHGVGDGALHGAAEHHALFQLLGYSLGHQLRVQLGLADLGDVQAHIVHRHPQDLRHAGAELLDVLALLADHDSRPRRMDGDVGAPRGALDMDAAHRGVGKLLVQILPHQVIGVDIGGKRFGSGIPLRRPVARDAESNADRIYFLTHLGPRTPPATLCRMSLLCAAMRTLPPLARVGKRVNIGAGPTWM